MISKEAQEVADALVALCNKYSIELSGNTDMSISVEKVDTEGKHVDWLFGATWITRDGVELDHLSKEKGH